MDRDRTTGAVAKVVEAAAVGRSRALAKDFEAIMQSVTAWAPPRRPAPALRAPVSSLIKMNYFESGSEDYVVDLEIRPLVSAVIMRGLVGGGKRVVLPKGKIAFPFPGRGSSVPPGEGAGYD